VVFSLELGGSPLMKGDVKKRIGFVRQQDFLVECLTGMSISYFGSGRHLMFDAVRETLTYVNSFPSPYRLMC